MNIPSAVRTAYTLFLDALFPIRCIECASFGDWLCVDCLATVAAPPKPACLGCALVSSQGAICRACKPRWQLDGIMVIASYHDPIVRHLLKQFKYRYLEGAAQPLLTLAERFLLVRRIHNDFDVILPVPLARRRELSRGFNQSEILARGIAARLARPFMSDNLIRIKNTSRQSYLSLSRRQRNVERAFRLNAPAALKGKKILLIDDIATSGHTLNECARVIKAAGAVQVWALVWARG